MIFVVFVNREKFNYKSAPLLLGQLRTRISAKMSFRSSRNFSFISYVEKLVRRSGPRGYSASKNTTGIWTLIYPVADVNYFVQRASKHVQWNGNWNRLAGNSNVRRKQCLLIADPQIKLRRNNEEKSNTKYKQLFCWCCLTKGLPTCLEILIKN